MADFLDKLDQGIERYERRFADLLPEGGAGPVDFAALVQRGQQGGRAWSDLLGAGGEMRWGQLLGERPGLSWGQLLGGGGAGLDWGGMTQPGFGGLNRGFARFDQLVNTRLYEEEAKAAASGERGQGQAVTERGGNTGAGGAASWLQGQRADSPLVGIADDLAAYAVSKGIDPGVVFGLLRKESQYGADGALGIRSNNPGNIMAPGADPANGRIILQQFPDLLAGTKAIVDLLAGYGATYGARTLEDMIAIYYVGPEAYRRYGLDANDAGGRGPGGNGTVRDYLNQHIYPVVQSYNNRPGAQRQPAGGQAPVNVEGTAFPVQGYRGNIELHWGEDPGAADIFAAAGTPVAAMRGGRVVSAGWSDIGGWNVTIQGDDGLTYYYAHLQSQPSVRAGQTVQGGAIFGAVGDTGNAKGTGAHLHLGIGYGIQSGTGPRGGSGINFNATEYLRRVLGLAVQGGPAANSGAGGPGTLNP